MRVGPRLTQAAGGGSSFKAKMASSAVQEAGLPSHLQAHASAAVGASSAAVVGVVGLGDPVMDLVAPNLPFDLLAELDMVPGGCIAVDGEEMARLLSRREVASQLHRQAWGQCAAVHGPVISSLHASTWGSQPCIVSLLFLSSLTCHPPACLPQAAWRQRRQRVQGHSRHSSAGQLHCELRGAGGARRPRRGLPCAPAGSRGAG